jgi:iron complex transport system substrate-binding protein
MGISIFSRLGICIVAAALAPVATYGNVAETAQKLRIASLNLCTDTLLLQYADPQQIASITWLSSDANLSPFATYAQQFHRNQGRAEDIFRLPIDLVLTGPSTSPTTRAMLRRMQLPTLHLEDATSINALSINIRRLTQAIGQSARGNESLLQMNEKLTKISSDSYKTPTDQWPYAAFLQPNGLTVGHGSLSNELLNLAGFRNSATSLGLKTYQRFPLESLLRARPDLIIAPTDQPKYPALAQELLQHPALSGTMLRHQIDPSTLICGTSGIADVAVALAAKRQQLVH